MTRRLLLQCLGTALLLAGFAKRAFAVDFPDWYTVANAAALKTTKVHQDMLRRGDNPNFTDSAGRTPLGYAASFGNVAMMKVLLDDARAHRFPRQFPPHALHSAAELGRSRDHSRFARREIAGRRHRAAGHHAADARRRQQQGRSRQSC